MEMGGNFCQILELGGGTTIKGRRVCKRNLFITVNIDHLVYRLPNDCCYACISKNHKQFIGLLLR